MKEKLNNVTAHKNNAEEFTNKTKELNIYNKCNNAKKDEIYMKKLQQIFFHLIFGTT